MAADLLDTVCRIKLLHRNTTASMLATSNPLRLGKISDLKIAGFGLKVGKTEATSGWVTSSEQKWLI